MRSYSQIAKALGKPTVRWAVGGVNHNNLRNHTCYSMIGSDGTLSGYAGGLDVKKRLLRLEGIL